MNTLFLLLAEYETGQIPLRDVAEKYLNMDEAQAKRLAGTQSLPFPVYKGSLTQKGKWLVHVQDLAAFIDQQRKEAFINWRKLNAKPNRQDAGSYNALTTSNLHGG